MPPGGRRALAGRRSRRASGGRVGNDRILPEPARGRPGDNGRVSTQTPMPTARRRRPGRSFTGLLWSLVPIVVVGRAARALAAAARRRRWSRSTPAPTSPTRSASRRCRCPRPARCRATGGRPARTWTRRADADIGQPTLPKRSPVTLTIGYLTERRQVRRGRHRRPVRSTCCSPRPQPQATADGTAIGRCGPLGGIRNQRGEQLLVTTIGKAGVLVTGDASGTDLAELAASVR